LTQICPIESFNPPLRKYEAKNQWYMSFILCINVISTVHVKKKFVGLIIKLRGFFLLNPILNFSPLGALAEGLKR